ncbi:MAG: hypothetical protein J6K05_01455 [Bacteroidaceae bacterium]|nr:hypothetical protein [Bacteroidaceae bacterium]
MIMHASNGCYLTQREDVPMSKRQFLTSVNIQRMEDAEIWKEITKKEKEEMLAKVAVIDVDNMTIEGIDNVASLLGDISARINTVEMTDEQALDRVAFFPKWEDLIGTSLPTGFRLSQTGKLYEVVQEHTASREWIPGEGTESLYKEVVIMEETTGTKDNPIAYDGNMELMNGLYYSQDGITYLCNRDSGIPVYQSLAGLVGLYVEVVPNEEENV